jgi:hypothetical protein
VAPQTPPDFVPPKKWTPPASAPASSRPLRYRPRRGPSGFGAGTALALMGLGGYVTWRVTSASATAPQEAQITNVVGQALSAVNGAIDLAKGTQGAAPGDKLPVVCNGNDNVQIMGKTLASVGVPVIAQGDCTLRLIGCAVSGSIAINAGGNAKVFVEGGSLAGKMSAVVLFGNSQLDVSGGTVLTGVVTVTAAGNSTARISGSTITGSSYAVEASGSAKVDTTGSEVHGKVSGAKRAAH